jgi:hypothetical protein
MTGLAIAHRGISVATVLVAIFDDRLSLFLRRTGFMKAAHVVRSRMYSNFGLDRP